jgi:alpha-glucosidase (family GH31 glycosyl hydrolase)
MSCALVALLLSASALPAATVLSSSRDKNVVFLQLSDGSAQAEWLSDSSFRFSRRWGASAAQTSAKSTESVPLKITDNPDSLTVATKYLRLAIAKRGVLVRVAEADDTPIMVDASEPELRDGALTWERMAPPGARFYGLGPRDDAAVELRGSRIAATKPFLISSAGYGEYHVAPANYSFDLARAKADRYRIEARGARAIDYYFFFGPTPKEISEQYLLLREPPGAAVVKGSLAQTIHSLINGSLSGVIAPAASLDPYLTIRGELAVYFATYAQETHDKGLPLIRALPMQFPKDAEAAKVGDEFMLGDELLIAPIYENGKPARVYLPMGIWTRLSDNRVFPGRQVIPIEGKPSELVLFSRSGSILPLGSGPMTLHYFPRLGAEFFLFESEPEDYSQAHAAPAGDFIRLEIESKKGRYYEWILHHMERPRKVVAGGVEFGEVASRELLQRRPSGWLYDSLNKNLYVWLLASAGEDVIASISF